MKRYLGLFLIIATSTGCSGSLLKMRGLLTKATRSLHASNLSVSKSQQLITNQDDFGNKILPWGFAQHTMTRMSDDRVLIAGGLDASSNASAVALIYNPSTTLVTYAPSLSNARVDHTAVLLQNHKVMIMGGSNNNVYTDSVEIYDPATNTWTSTGSLNNARSQFAAVVLPLSLIHI